MNNPEFVYAVHIATTPEKLWEALTSGAFTEQYWGARRIESDWQVGSPVRHVKPDGSTDWHGEVLRCEPLKVLSYTFQGEDCGDGMEPPSRVVFEISPSGPGTVMLKVIHGQLTEEGFQGISIGWPAILSSLKSLLETGKPLEYHWRG